MPVNTVSMPEPARLILRLEGLAVFAAATFAYAMTDGGWGLYLALALVPDLSMILYAFGPRIGAMGYNAAHSHVGPLILAIGGLALGWPVLPVALVWAAHIGLDRALGYGLKLPDHFQNTHLGPIGKARQ